MRTNVLDVRWPKTLSTEAVYEKTKVQPWSVIIRKIRLMCLGNLFRLPNETPVKKAFKYATQPYKRCRGRPSTTWISMMTRQLKDDFNLTWEEAYIKAINRVEWRTLINSI